MRPELEELIEFTEENFRDKGSEQGKSARNEVEELRQRLEILTAELDSKKTEVETVQKLQAKFQEQCRHLNAVLQDTEAKLRSEDDVEHLHEQEQSFEVKRFILTDPIKGVMKVQISMFRWEYSQGL